MSIPVEVAALREAVERHGSVAHLVTVGDGGAPHVVSVALRWDGDELVCAAGRTTVANAGARPGVTLLWPPGVEPGYCLITDATASADPGAGEVRLTPASAVLHRLAGALEVGPTCKPIG